MCGVPWPMHLGSSHASHSLKLALLLLMATVLISPRFHRMLNFTALLWEIKVWTSVHGWRKACVHRRGAIIDKGKSVSRPEVILQYREVGVQKITIQNQDFFVEHARITSEFLE